MTVGDVLKGVRDEIKCIEVVSCPVCDEIPKLDVDFGLVYYVEVRCKCGLALPGGTFSCSEYPDQNEIIKVIVSGAERLGVKWNNISVK